MSKYNCPRCGYSTNISQCYIKHIHRKNICKAIISNVTLENEHDKHIKHIKQIKNKKKEFKCSICGKVLSTKQVLNNHIKICETKQSTDKEEMNNKQLFIMMSKRIEDLEKKIKENPTINNNVLIKNTTINLVGYYDTDENKLSNREILKCMTKNINCVPTLIQTTHCNTKYPEHMNICLKDYNDKYIYIYSDGRWIITKKDDLIHDLIDKKSYFIYQQIETWKKNNEYSEEIKKFEKYINAPEDERCIDDIKDNVIIMLYNNREKIIKSQNEE